MADPVDSIGTAPEPLISFGEELQSALDGVLDADDAMGASLAVIVPGYQPWIGVACESEPATPITTEMAFGGREHLQELHRGPRLSAG